MVLTMAHGHRCKSKQIHNSLATTATGRGAPTPTYDLDYDRRAVDRPALRGFHGNYGCFVRAYAYICSLGAEG